MTGIRNFCLSVIGITIEKSSLTKACQLLLHMASKIGEVAYTRAFKASNMALFHLLVSRSFLCTNSIFNLYNYKRIMFTNKEKLYDKARLILSILKKQPLKLEAAFKFCKNSIKVLYSTLNLYFFLHRLYHSQILYIVCQ